MLLAFCHRYTVICTSSFPHHNLYEKKSMYLYTNNVSSAGQQLEALELASRVNTFSPPLKKKNNNQKPHMIWRKGYRRVKIHCKRAPLLVLLLLSSSEELLPFPGWYNKGISTLLQAVFIPMSTCERLTRKTRRGEGNTAARKTDYQDDNTWLFI